MFSFLSSILWTAVFCGGSYKLYKSIKAENINMDLTKDKVEKLTEQSPILWGLTTLEHLNNKANASSITLYASIIAFSLWAMEAQVLGGLFLLSILVFGVFFTLHLSRVMGDMGYSFFKFDKKFRLAQTPFFLCIILFFGVPQILPTPEVSNQPQATSNQKAKNSEKIQNLKSINSKLYKMQKKRYAHFETYDPEDSRIQNEKYDNKRKELYNAKEEYLESLQGLTFKGKCYLDLMSYSKSPDRFDKVITDALSPLSEKQQAEQYPQRLIICRQKPKSSKDGFFQDTQGSSYSFKVSNIWLTEKEIDLLDNLREGDSFNFTGTAYNLSDNELLTITKPNEYGLDITFVNKVWENGGNKETEKTIFFD